MLILDPEGPIPLDALRAGGVPEVQHVVDEWVLLGMPRPISGDPHFRRERRRAEPIPLGRAPWWQEEATRAGGDVVCPECGLTYWRHRQVTAEVPTLVRACDGRLLKL